MSEAGRERDELDSALRVLAADAAVAPSLSGDQIRRRGRARGRRRRVAGATAGAVALIAGVAFGVPQVMGARGADQPPAASTPSPSVPTPSALPVASLDTANMVLTVRGRGGRARSINVWMKDTSLIRLTVAAKDPTRRLPADEFPGGKYDFEAKWVVELTRAGGSPVYIAQTGKDANYSSHVISVGSADAKWVYDQLRAGDTIVPN